MSSDARDTDFTVKLVDVHPDGTACNADKTEWVEEHNTQHFREAHLGHISRPVMSAASTPNR